MSYCPECTCGKCAIARAKTAKRIWRKRAFGFCCDGGGGDCQAVSAYLALDRWDAERVAKWHGWSCGWGVWFCPTCTAIEWAEAVKATTGRTVPAKPAKIWRVKGFVQLLQEAGHGS